MFFKSPRFVRGKEGCSRRLIPEGGSPGKDVGFLDKGFCLHFAESE